MFETHHLDVEGGVGERRTGAAGKREEEKAVSVSRPSVGGGAAVSVEIEGEAVMEAVAVAAGEGSRTESLTKKKRVAFGGEQRELYDF